MQNIKQKKSRVATLISDKTDLRTRKITRDKEGHYIMRGFHYQILNLYSPDKRASNKMKQN